MNIDKLTIGQVKELLSVLGKGALSRESSPASEGLNGMVGKKVIVRTYSAGVWFGKLAEKSGNEVILTNARRMWRWHAVTSISLSAVSIHGINQSKSKIVEAVGQQWLEAIEITPCTEISIKSIEDACSVKAE